ncbi:MAG: ParB/Srx family N-terminal domain-containing protein [Acidobacteriia bacterium]|nr:ParB/Srx family N-terminal domain-containing protein [Terriglobia bacterium]
MAHPNLSKRQKVCDLESGLSIWRVHLDCLREQDKNARIMAPEKFERLAQNIKQSGRLESLPFTCNPSPEDPNSEFMILSGHHRTRASRKAGLTEIYVLNDQTPLKRSDVVAKQLAHNSLNGYDDKQILAQLYQEIDDINAKIESGLTDLDIEIPNVDVKADPVMFDIDYELVNILFVDRDFQRFKEVLELLSSDAHIYIADKADFDRFKDAAQKISSLHQVVNAAAIMARLLDIVHFYLVKRGQAEAGENWVPLATIFDGDSVPEAAAKVIQEAVDKMEADGNVGAKNRWQAIELWAADHLSGR